MQLIEERKLCQGDVGEARVGKCFLEAELQVSYRMTLSVYIVFPGGKDT